MHSIFAPGFPGLLEAFYVQERLMEWLMPDVFQSFVSVLSTFTTAPHPRTSAPVGRGRPHGRGRGPGLSANVSVPKHDLVLSMGYQVVHHPVRQHRAVLPAAPIVGRALVGRERRGDHDVCGDPVGFQRWVEAKFLTLSPQHSGAGAPGDTSS
jgi:hypothetical protein